MTTGCWPGTMRRIWPGTTGRSPRPSNSRRGPHNNINLTFNWSRASTNLVNSFPSLAGHTATQGLNTSARWTYGKGRTNNTIGMASVGRNVRILPVRVLGKCGGFISDVIAGMRWAAGLSSTPVPNPTPAKVLNLSLGSSGSCTGSLYETAVADVVAAGVSVVVSAGNDVGLAVGRPANCPGAIGVGGGDPDEVELGDGGHGVSLGRLCAVSVPRIAARS